MEQKDYKLVGFKADINDDKIINIRAEREGLDKSKFYRKIVDEYFKNHPLSEAEKELFK